MARSYNHGRGGQFKHGISVKKTETLYNKSTRNATPGKGAVHQKVKISRFNHKKMK